MDLVRFIRLEHTDQRVCFCKVAAEVAKERQHRGREGGGRQWRYSGNRSWLHEEAVNDLLELGESWWMGSNGYMMVDGIQRIYHGGWDPTDI
jgi:hypothetical protein